MQPAPSGASNPLSRLALESPAMLGSVLSIGARLAGAVLAAYMASDQAYDRTQVFAAGIAASVLLTLVPAAAVARVTLSSLASGVLFFAGAALLDQTAGIAMLLTGVFAIMGVLVVNHRADGAPAAPVGAFFLALALIVAWMAVIALTIEG
jgi:hypothetical protein